MALAATGRTSTSPSPELTDEGLVKALCCYEHLITFDEEVRCIWRRRISAATILFVVNRYAILALSAASIIGIIPWKSQPEAYFSQQRVSTGLLNSL